METCPEGTWKEKTCRETTLDLPIAPDTSKTEMVSALRLLAGIPDLTQEKGSIPEHEMEIQQGCDSPDDEKQALRDRSLER